MTSKERLFSLCEQALVEKGLIDDQHRARLALELKDIDAQNEHDYFLNLYDSKTKYEENENNLLVPYLLGIVTNVDINKEPSCIFGDFPDIDSDFIPAVRDYLKQEWAPKQFGVENVCNIGSYNTFGIKSALQNMARVFNKPRHEIVDLTTQLGLKDDDGKVLTWDKALEMYPALKKYCEDNPEVADAAEKLLFRNMSMGKHAGGLIISSKRIDDFVPLVKDKDGTPTSAWVEGLHGQDLGPMGLVKYDLLVVTNLMQIALACKLVKERHKLDKICALPDQQDWSDLAYLDDPQALAMANRGDLKCVFQFDSQGIRQMAKEGGVTRFEDLVAYTSLYRPGPMMSGLHHAYTKRKRGLETYELHPLLKPILSMTYGCLIYQESIMQILNLVGEIPLKDCEIVRKAISKKRVDLFQRYKDQFIVNGKKNLGWSDEQMEDFWKQIEAFAGYSFNLSHAVAYSYISARLLWLKAHYPLEFFAAILACETQPEKIREYKMEATRHGVTVMPVDINKSGVTFRIVGNTLDLKQDFIYYGLSNIKGIGEAIAQRIVDCQPYQDFKDFLGRFGTDASVVKPLIGLRVFQEDTPVEMYKRFEWFKGIKKKATDRKRRLDKRIAVLTEQLRNLLPQSLHHLVSFTKENYEEVKAIIEGGRWPFGECPELDGRLQWQDEDGQMYTLLVDIESVYDAFDRSVGNYNKKTELGQPMDFDPSEVGIDDELALIYNSVEESEKAYYGFFWTHPLEKSPDYEGGMTFEDFRNEKIVLGPLECRIVKVEGKTSKKSNKYCLLKVEDANSEEGFVQVWMDDWERFNEEFQEGVMLRMKIRAPDGGFRRYTFDSPARNKRNTLPADKSKDPRLHVMRRQ